MNEVIACSYLGISHPDPEEWRTFAAAGLGAEVAPESEDERLLLRIDQRAWRFWIEKGEKALRFVGWEVASDSALELSTAEQKSAIRRRKTRPSCYMPGGVA